MTQGMISKDFSSIPKFKFSENDKNLIRAKEPYFHLKHLLSSSLSPMKYKRAFELLCIVARGYSYNDCFANFGVSHDWNDNGFGLNSTPLNLTTLASRKIIENFKASTRVDQVNVIYLTDGDGTSCFELNGQEYHRRTSDNFNDSNRVYMTDPKTKTRHLIASSRYCPNLDSVDAQGNLTKFIRTLTGAKHIGFRLIPLKKMRKFIRSENHRDVRAIEKAMEEYNKNGYYARGNIGYDNFYYTAMNHANVKDQDYVIEGTKTARGIARKFIDAQDNKRKNRVLISHFAREIATNS
jgi:hypothetical protein